MAARCVLCGIRPTAAFGKDNRQALESNAGRHEACGRCHPAIAAQELSVLESKNLHAMADLMAHQWN
jgi:predicted PP-loop superfamily ATPase